MRLCGLNPTMDYTPVWWAMMRDDSGRFIVVPSNLSETTVTAFEGLSDDDRAVLCILHADVEYSFYKHEWKIVFDHSKGEVRLSFQPDAGMSMKEFLGHFLDSFIAPVLMESDAGPRYYPCLKTWRPDNDQPA